VAAVGLGGLGAFGAQYVKSVLAAGVMADARGRRWRLPKGSPAPLEARRRGVIVIYGTVIAYGRA